MTAARLVILCLCLLGAQLGRADIPPPKILVTFADPGINRAARAGPVRPGYGRRTGTYLVSIEVRRAAKRIENDFNLRQLDEWPIDPLKVHCIVYAVDNGEDVDSLLARLREQPRVESAQRMNTFDVLGPDRDSTTDPYADLQASMDRLEIAAAHHWTRGKGSSVTIIDTGADIWHPELRSRIDEHVDFVDDDAEEFAADAHGTAVAGIIGASSDNGIGIVGVAPSASLSILKACWYSEGRSTAQCDSFTLAKALSFAIDSRTNVINLSLGGPDDALLSRLVDRALTTGKVVIAAAPRDDGHRSFPGSVDGVIVVADADSAATRRDTALYAPGRDILVPIPGGGFDFASGSSLSAAHVSGIAALLIASRPSLTHQDVRALLAAASPNASVSACLALAQLLEEPGCNPVTSAVDGAR